MVRSGMAVETLIFGRNGQLARELARAEAPGLDRTFIGRETVDLSRPEAAADAVRFAKPELVIIAAAYTAVDRAETEEAVAHAVNGLAPRAIAEACAEVGAAVVHVSTDYVFDGSKPGPYVESDPTAPINAYGRTKLAGEAGVLGSGGAAAVVRTAWVYSPFGSNFVKTMLRLAGERDVLRVVGDQLGSPTAAGDLAAAVLALGSRLARGDAAAGGLFHYAGAGETSWAGFAEAVMAGSPARGRKGVPVIAISTAEFPTPARRPANSRLDAGRMAALGIAPRPWREALDDVLDELLPAEA
jgi:dTDP-4-dehydrorhamnose reductase